MTDGRDARTATAAETAAAARVESTFMSLLGPAERADLDMIGRPRLYRRGEILFLEGDPSDTVYLVVEGRARVYTTSSEGTEVTLSVRGPGDLIGEMSTLDPGSRRSASVTALGPLRARVISAPHLQTYLETHPQAAVALLRLVIGRLREADRRRTEFGSYDTTRRLARLLLECATETETGTATGAGSQPRDASRPGERNGGQPIALSLSQGELAGLIGASRESVGRGLAELRRRGLVDTGRRAITIRDPLALGRFAT